MLHYLTLGCVKLSCVAVTVISKAIKHQLEQRLISFKMASGTDNDYLRPSQSPFYVLYTLFSRPRHS